MHHTRGSAGTDDGRGKQYVGPGGRPHLKASTPVLREAYRAGQAVMSTGSNFPETLHRHAVEDPARCLVQALQQPDVAHRHRVRDVAVAPCLTRSTSLRKPAP